MPRHAVALLCRVLEVSSSGCDAWRKRGRSTRAQDDGVLTERITLIHQASRTIYDTPRIHTELKAAGVKCRRKRVDRLMQAAQFVGCHRRRQVITTVREPTAPVAPDRVEREFVAITPNELWSADLTYIRLPTAFCYLAAILDACSRRRVGS